MLAFLDFVCMCDFQKNNVISCFEKPRAIAIVMANRQTRGMSPDSIVRKLFVEEEEAIEMKTFSDGEYITNLFSIRIQEIFFQISDHGWIKIRIRDKHPGPVTLLFSIVYTGQCCGSETKVSDPVSDPDPA